MCRSDDKPPIRSHLHRVPVSDADLAAQVRAARTRAQPGAGLSLTVCVQVYQFRECSCDTPDPDVLSDDISQ